MPLPGELPQSAGASCNARIDGQLRQRKNSVCAGPGSWSGGSALTIATLAKKGMLPPHNSQTGMPQPGPSTSGTPPTLMDRQLPVEPLHPARRPRPCDPAKPTYAPRRCVPGSRAAPPAFRERLARFAPKTSSSGSVRLESPPPARAVRPGWSAYNASLRIADSVTNPESHPRSGGARAVHPEPRAGAFASAAARKRSTPRPRRTHRPSNAVVPRQAIRHTAEENSLRPDNSQMAVGATWLNLNGLAREIGRAHV